jgi:hypothetical protein
MASSLTAILRYASKKLTPRLHEENLGRHA